MTVVKAVRDALHEKVEKCKDLKIEFEKIQKIAEEIEIAMFGKQWQRPLRFQLITLANLFV
jgi:hypothetical protein